MVKDIANFISISTAACCTYNSVSIMLLSSGGSCLLPYIVHHRLSIHIFTSFAESTHQSGHSKCEPVVSWGFLAPPCHDSC